MKTKMYAISEGRYEDYEVVAHVTGPAKPALSSLCKEFETACGFRRITAREQREDVCAVMHIKNASMTILRAKYPDIAFPIIANSLVRWLCENHGFTVVDVPEIRY